MDIKHCNTCIIVAFIPVPYWVDDFRSFFDQGILIMHYLQGESLEYQRAYLQAAEVFATIHQIDVPETNNHLIHEDSPPSLIYKECTELLRDTWVSLQNYMNIGFIRSLFDPILENSLR